MREELLDASGGLQQRRRWMTRTEGATYLWNLMN
jgi:hypothetical protein